MRTVALSLSLVSSASASDTSHHRIIHAINHRHYDTHIYIDRIIILSHSYHNNPSAYIYIYQLNRSHISMMHMTPTDHGDRAHVPLCEMSTSSSYPQLPQSNIPNIHPHGPFQHVEPRSPNAAPIPTDASDQRIRIGYVLTIEGTEAIPANTHFDDPRMVARLGTNDELFEIRDTFRANQLRMRFDSDHSDLSVSEVNVPPLLLQRLYEKHFHVTMLEVSQINALASDDANVRREALQLIIDCNLKRMIIPSVLHLSKVKTHSQWYDICIWA